MDEYTNLNKDELIALLMEKDKEIQRIERFKTLLVTAIIHHYQETQ